MSDEDTAVNLINEANLPALENIGGEWQAAHLLYGEDGHTVTVVLEATSDASNAAIADIVLTTARSVLDIETLNPTELSVTVTARSAAPVTPWAQRDIT